MEIAVIDYGNGNLGSLLAALRRLGQQPRVIRDAHDIRPVDTVIFPGVGSLASVIDRLKDHGLFNWLNELYDAQTPILGICLGLQLFFDHGAEGGEGLHWIKGSVPEIQAPILPHIGWNTVDVSPHPFLWKGLAAPYTFYFVHTYRILPEDTSIVRGVTQYYEPFPVAIESPPLYGVQFHPELSGHKGAQVLRNFLEMVENPHGNLASRRLA
ncbi:imidazole glycerol phosphate synthase subunit HisH [Sulfobacillus thermosulfidooxidans]|uniref:imidazole glycerol phosphate synthase subunit HisH n=1 Tax=Sulfobacillus thermosulfidooxidans TaxID=28034 RepID=UPI00096BCCC7|nr:imidazole glycerol phosphate synthase subunit HisH [Sulfobacillus thermosulfidooxidans]OLZ10549.1 imidazole glycerol phosphate synthase, glutamine amidotransferase subunit [Sulfobacillus thermosulfidooxidans]OLZ15237.1 imidazole glycerol phosphate synthase, glutamine amidotransferase subunit [Sulfobacillus thermosulfidooxidans]OLZ22226.1 imidazole glycerol phosphate synthase, glutamine amidotransferase subunit [Sulfobacillus thermosulfidooxidans]